MKIVKLKGGLGNQMFQYAFAKALLSNSKDLVKLDTSWINCDDSKNIAISHVTNFNINLPIATNDDIDSICLTKHDYRHDIKYKLEILFEVIFNNKYYFEKDRSFRNIDSINEYSYFDGYWQSYRYFDQIFDELKKDFAPRKELSSETRLLIDRVKNENSVFVGVRRGDYLKYKKRYGDTNLDYYLKSMDYIEKIVSNPVYYIFSNDIDWVERNMDFGNKKINYRKNEDVVDDFEELILMSNCKHSIIQNSTYHWWGARLNYYDGKIVIAPGKWFKDGSQIDIIPSEWIKI